MLTTDSKNNILNHVFRNVALPSPTTVFVGLFNSTGEVTGAGYERQEISFGAPTNGIIKNDVEVRFPIAAADWGEVTGAGIFDSEGNRLDDATITSTRIVRENDQFSIPIGNYTIELR
jgi:hypothetical protein